VPLFTRSLSQWLSYEGFLLLGGFIHCLDGL
jgi:hypothetical protein